MPTIKRMIAPRHTSAITFLTGRATERATRGGLSNQSAGNVKGSGRKRRSVLWTRSPGGNGMAERDAALVNDLGGDAMGRRDSEIR